MQTTLASSLEEEKNFRILQTGIDEISRKFGLMVNAEKGKTSFIEKTKQIPQVFNIQGEFIEQVEQFVYLGGHITADGSYEIDIQMRIGRTSPVFGMMNLMTRR